MLRPKVSPPTPQRAPKPIALSAAEGSAPRISERELPRGTARRAPSSGKTIHANTPCTSQKLSQLHSRTFFIGTYELDWQKLPNAIIISPITIFIFLSGFLQLQVGLRKPFIIWLCW